MTDESVALIDGKLKESRGKLQNIAKQLNEVGNEITRLNEVSGQLTGEAQRLQGEQRALADVYQGITGKEYKFPEPRAVQPAVATPKSKKTKKKE